MACKIVPLLNDPRKWSLVCKNDKLKLEIPPPDKKKSGPTPPPIKIPPARGPLIPWWLKVSF